MSPCPSLISFLQVQLDTLQKINLQHNTNLKTIMIEDLFLTVGGETSQMLSDLISRISSANLNEITFSIRCQEVEELHTIDWKKIDLNLADSRFERLRKVIILYECGAG